MAGKRSGTAKRHPPVIVDGNGPVIVPENVNAEIKNSNDQAIDGVALTNQSRSHRPSEWTRLCKAESTKDPAIFMPRRLR